MYMLVHMQRLAEVHRNSLDHAQLFLFLYLELLVANYIYVNIFM